MNRKELNSYICPDCGHFVILRNDSRTVSLYCRKCDNDKTFTKNTSDEENFIGGGYPT